MVNEFKLIDESTGNVSHFDTRSDAQERKQDIQGLTEGPLKIEHVDGKTDGGDAEVADPADEPRNAKPVEPGQLSENPIGFLESVNTDFVNTIKGKPAISKQGFRFIQREFEISTESKVVEWSEDPLGCVVWAKAELPNGYSAEAHGEGYQFEKDVSDNEFVRYADTRAKNRALSDLTSAGALAVSELQGDK